MHHAEAEEAKEMETERRDPQERSLTTLTKDHREVVEVEEVEMITREEEEAETMHQEEEDQPLMRPRGNGDTRTSQDQPTKARLSHKMMKSQISQLKSKTDQAKMSSIAKCAL